MVKLTINGIDITVDTTDEAARLLASMASAPSARKSTAGTIKEGSAHDLYVKASPEARARIIRQFVADKIAIEGQINRFTVGFLSSAKPAGVMFREWLASGEIPLPDSTIVELADESVKRVGFNSSTISVIFRAYNLSTRAALVK